MNNKYDFSTVFPPTLAKRDSPSGPMVFSALQRPGFSQWDPSLTEPVFTYSLIQ